MKSMKRITMSLSFSFLFSVQRIFTLIKFLTNFFGSGNVHEFLLGFFLVIFVLEVIWMPLLSQFPVGFADFLLTGVPAYAQNLVVISFTGLFLPFLCRCEAILGPAKIFIKL